MQAFDILHTLHDHTIPLDHIAQQIPGILHVNSTDDFRPLYIDPKSIDQLGLDIIEDFKPQDGLSFVHPDDLDYALKATQYYLDHIDDYKTISFVQRILNPRLGQYRAYYTTSLLIEERGGLVSFSIPIGDIPLNNSSVDQIISEINFIRRHMKRFARLTRRERELMKLWVNKQNNQSITEVMDISINTVKSYKKNIYRKLGINQYNQLFEYAKAFEVI